MAEYEKDENGRIKPHDDPNIQNYEHLLRYFHHMQLVDDEKAPNGRRLSSGSFSPSSTPNYGISVNLQERMEENDENPREFKRDGRGIARLEVGSVRELDLWVGHSPVEADNEDGINENPYHAEIWGNGRRVTGAKKKALSKACEIYVEPTEEEK